MNSNRKGGLMNTLPLSLVCVTMLLAACNGQLPGDAVGTEQADGSTPKVGNFSLRATSGDPVTLDANNILGLSGARYFWSHLSGPAVPIDDPTNAVLQFIAPDVEQTTFIILALRASTSEVSINTAVTLTIVPAGVEIPASCDDGVQNGDETGVDCGGSCPECPPPPPACGDAACNGGEDCTSCPEDCGECQAPPPACGDGVCNDSEDCASCASDCGECTTRDPLCGSEADACHSDPLFDSDYCSSSCPCAWGEGDCDSDSQCQDGLECEYNIGADFGLDSGLDLCVKPGYPSNQPMCSGSSPTPTCNDGVQNGDETGVDCGGSCTACTVSPSCNDGVQNGDETGVDCGGSCVACAPTTSCGDGTCDANESCSTCASDCGSCPIIGTCGDGTCGSNEHCGTCASDCGACSGSAPTLARVPYLQRAGSSQMTIKWRTQSNVDSVVVYGEQSGQLLNKAVVSGSRTRHEVKLSGLKPDTKYFYAFGSEGRPLHGASADHFFRTSPSVGTKKSTRIWVIGDSGKPGDDQIDVFNQYTTYTGNRGTDLWLMLGDNAYSDGTDSEYEDGMFKPYSKMLRNTPLFPTLGNHDDCLNRVSSGSCTDLPESLDNVAPYYDIFTLPEDGESGGLRSGTEAYYSVDYGDIHLVSLNSQTHSNSSAMQAWLEADLQQTTATWIVAFWHHPAYTNGSHNSDNEGSLSNMRENFVGILESYGVDLVFAGHSHQYERTAFLNGYIGESSTFDPAKHVMARNANGSLSDGDPNGDGAYQKSGTKGAVYSVVGSSSKVSDSDYPTRYWSCKDGFMMSCPNGPILPGMIVYLEHLGSVVVDIDPAGGFADVVFLDTTTGTIGDRYRIEK